MRAALDKFQCRIEMIGEKRRPAAVIGKRRHRRQGVLVAHEAAKARLHAPDCKQRAGRNPVAFLKLCKEGRIGILERAAPGDNPGGPALCHEGIERQLETVLAPVGPDGALRIAGAHEGGDCLWLHPIGLCLNRKAFFPRFKTAARAAAFGRLRRTRHEN